MYIRLFIFYTTDFQGGEAKATYRMKLLFSAADVTIVSSLSENLSYMIIESMCIGTPVAAFNVGGNSDLIEHLNNGFLAQPRNQYELAEGMLYLLDDENSKRLKESSRAKNVTNFDRDLILKMISGIIYEYTN